MKYSLPRFKKLTDDVFAVHYLKKGISGYCNFFQRKKKLNTIILLHFGCFAVRFAIIRKGVIVEEAEPSQLLSMEMRRIHVRFKEPVNPILLDQVDGISLLSQRNGLFVTLQVEGEMDGIIKALAAFPVVDIDVDKPTLEEIFLAYYAADDKEVS